MRDILTGGVGHQRSNPENKEKSFDEHIALYPDGRVDPIETSLNELRQQGGAPPHRNSSTEDLSEWLRTHKIDSPKATFMDWLREDTIRCRDEIRDWFRIPNLITMLWLFVGLVAFAFIGSFIQWLFGIKQ